MLERRHWKRRPCSRSVMMIARFQWTAFLCILSVMMLCDHRTGCAVAAQQQRRRSDRNGGRHTGRADLKPGNHTSNAAVLVSSSRYWHNYRHVSNVLLMYELLKSYGGMSDDDIILMIADDVPCNSRNPFRNRVFAKSTNRGRGESLYDEHTEIDYRGTDVTVDAFLRVLTGRHLPGELPGRTLDLKPGTNLLVYLTGHGGDQFFKFQDGEEVTAQDLASTFRQMKALGRYNDLLLVADTCQAFTLDPSAAGVQGSEFVRDVTTIASSLKDQNSYAHHSDADLGLSVVDRYTYHVSDFLKSRDRRNKLEGISLKEAMVDRLGGVSLGADVGMSDRTSQRRAAEVPLCDFLCDRKRSEGGAKVTVLRDRSDFSGRASATGKGSSEATEEGAAREGETRERRGLDAVVDVGEEPRECELPNSTSDGEPADAGWDARGGMRPSDPRFLLCAIGLVFAVRLSSNWS